MEGGRGIRTGQFGGKIKKLDSLMREVYLGTWTGVFDERGLLGNMDWSV